jgi:hypothetical protein
MSIKYSRRSSRKKQYFPFQGPQKYTQSGIFWYYNIPSGNPVMKTYQDLISSFLVIDLFARSRLNIPMHYYIITDYYYRFITD